jgi:hypothetical protein
LCQEDPYLLELVRYIHLNPFVETILKAAQENLERKYRLEADGCDFKWLVERVANQRPPAEMGV